jgi:hypothetical protein
MHDGQWQQARQQVQTRIYKDMRGEEHVLAHKAGVSVCLCAGRYAWQQA